MDIFNPKTRSAIMRAIRSRDTQPELRVRRAAHALGLRFRLGRRDLPGSPDLVFPGRRLALFVHGCFWHGHDCGKRRRPATNAAYWRAKIIGNRRRDRRVLKTLADMGWRTMVIWECDTREPKRLSPYLKRISRLPRVRRGEDKGRRARPLCKAAPLL
jgi:DNA mismatch endonuclease, patch repair protein